MTIKAWRGGGGQVKIYPYKKKGGSEQVLAMLKGGTTSFEVVLAQEHEVLAILIWGGG